MSNKRSRTSIDTANGIGHANMNGSTNGSTFHAAADINDNPDRVKFA